MGKGDDRTLWQIQIVDEKNTEKACIALTRLREPEPSSKSQGQRIVRHREKQPSRQRRSDIRGGEEAKWADWNPHKDRDGDIERLHNFNSKEIDHGTSHT